MKRTTSESSAPPSNDTSGDNIRPIEYSIPMESPVRGPGRSIRGISATDDSSAETAGDSDSTFSAPPSNNPIVSDSEEDDDDMAYISKALKPSRRGSQYTAVVEHVRRASVATNNMDSTIHSPHNGSVSRTGTTFAPPAAARLQDLEPTIPSDQTSVTYYPPSPTPAIVPSNSTSTSSSSTATTSSTPRETSSQSSVAPLASVSSPRVAGSPGGLSSSANRWQTVKPQSGLSPRMIRQSAEKAQAPIILTSSSSAILMTTSELTRSPPQTSASSPNLQRIANYHASRRRALGASGHINSMAISETERAAMAPPSPRSPTPSPTTASVLHSPLESPKLSDEQVDDLVSELMKDVQELGMAGEDSQAVGT
eukprot:TRINITY_DN5672_c0_g2_i1.p1 TRINITY_DN5672_c0_g2~~TRINITY_DN5672_c0_g2_i1.p1  ORF type:complete len:368 (-),score=52.97 TRINITY_DN5672_c0_g2_i1:177-1280(-)